MTSPLQTIETGKTPSQVIEAILSVLLPDAQTILDLTWGNGAFWANSRRQVVGMDLDPARARNVCGDFMRPPFADNAVDVVVFDPPFITNPGKAGGSVMAGRFASFPTTWDLEVAVFRGVWEAARLSRIGAIFKVQDQVRSARLLEMTQWVREAWGGPPYQRIDALGVGHKVRASNWTEQYSAYANGSTYLVYRHGSQYHRRRGGAVS